MSRVALVLFLAATASAQVVVLPAAVATTRPASSPFYDSSVFYATATGVSDSRAQLIYAATDISVPAGLFQSLSVRRPTGLGNANNAFTANATIILSMSPLAYGSMTNTFASNHGPTSVTVLSGPISLPAATNPGTWPAPWLSPAPFTTPFVLIRAAGQSLVVDIHQTGNTGGTPWYVETTYPDGGTRGENGGYQANCKFSTGNANGAIGYRLPVVGGVWTLNYQGGLPTNLRGIAALGVTGVGGTWGGAALPINLAFLGSPTCSWNISVEFSIPMTSTTTLYQWPNITIPNDPALGGAVFYDHAFFVDPPANAGGLVTTWSSKWTIGTNRGAPAAMLYAVATNAGNATGTLAQERGVSLQLNP